MKISPSFACYLGVEDLVRIDYRPEHVTTEAAGGVLAKKTTVRRVVQLEPPVAKGWASTRPHLNSHWQSISKLHTDPPPRSEAEEKPIVNYRRPSLSSPTKGGDSTPLVVWGGSPENRRPSIIA